MKEIYEFLETNHKSNRENGNNSLHVNVVNMLSYYHYDKCHYLAPRNSHGFIEYRTIAPPMKCFFECNIQESSGEYLPASHYAIKINKLYSHSKNKKEISSFVYQHLTL